MVSLVHFQLLSAALFAIGLYGVLARRSAVLIVMSIELMLNAVNINLIATASHLGYRDAGEVFANFDGQIIAIFRDNGGRRGSGPGAGHNSADVPQPVHGERRRDRPDEMVASSQPSAISHQPSAISHQRSALSSRPLALGMESGLDRAMTLQMAHNWAAVNLEEVQLMKWWPGIEMLTMSYSSHLSAISD